MRLMVKVHNQLDNTWNHMVISFEGMTKLDEINDMTVKLTISGEIKSMTDKATFDASKHHVVPEKMVTNEGGYTEIKYIKQPMKQNYISNSPIRQNQSFMGSSLLAPHMASVNEKVDVLRQEQFEPILCHDYRSSVLENSISGENSHRTLTVHDEDVDNIRSNGRKRESFFKRNSPYVYNRTSQNKNKLCRGKILSQSLMMENDQQLYHKVADFARKKFGIRNDEIIPDPQWIQAAQEYKSPDRESTSIITLRGKSLSPRSPTPSVITDNKTVDHEEQASNWAFDYHR